MEEGGQRSLRGSAAPHVDFRKSHLDMSPFLIKLTFLNFQIALASLKRVSSPFI